MAINILVLGILSATGGAAILTVITVLAPDWVVHTIHQPWFKPYLWMVPCGVWLGGLYACFQMWSARKKRFSDVAKTQFYRAMGGSGAQLGFGLHNATPFGLVFGHFLYVGLGSVRLARLLWKHDRALLGHVTRHKLWENLKEQRKFPLYSVPESILNSASVNLPLLVIAASLGESQAGFMLLAQRVGSIPVSLLGANISRVYLAHATEKREAGELGPFTRKIMWSLFKVGGLPFLLLAIAAPFLFSMIFGTGWDRAGVMLAWLAPAMFMQFITVPVSTILHATGNQPKALALQVAGTVLTIGGLVLASQVAVPWSFEIFALASLLYYVLYFAVVYKTTLEQQGN